MTPDAAAQLDVSSRKRDRGRPAEPGRRKGRGARSPAAYRRGLSAQLAAAFLALILVLVVVLVVTGLVLSIRNSPIGTVLTKHGAILGPGSAGSWDAGLVESPMVFHDASGWRMVYVGYSEAGIAQIGAATSPDPAGPWTKTGPILGPRAGGPFVLREGGLYYLFYICLGADGYEQGTKALCLATSPDFGAWTRQGVVVAPTGHGWASTAIWHPNVLRVRGAWYLFLNANGPGEAIGYATSTDLRHWTLSAEPVLIATTGWESEWIGDPSIYRADGRWWMAYYGYDGHVTQDGLAWTTDAAFPGGWQRWTANPVLRVDPGETGAGKPFVLRTRTGFYHYYTIVAGGSRSIGLATG